MEKKTESEGVWERRGINHLVIIALSCVETRITGGGGGGRRRERGRGRDGWREGGREEGGREMDEWMGREKGGGGRDICILFVVGTGSKKFVSFSP